MNALLTDSELQAIGHDLELCAIGLGVAKGALLKKYQRQHKACLDALKADNEARGLDTGMSDDDILNELGAL